jgi:dTDP-glucose 4,6-dehydratase
MVKRCLVTGGAGFIASHLCERLLKEGYEVKIFDRYAGKHKSIHLTDLEAKVEVVKGDVCDSAKLLEAMRDVDICFHLASIVGIQNVQRYPILTMKTLMDGTYNALDACSKSGVEKLIATSTSEVYGEYDTGFSEEHATPVGAPTDNRWTYQASKVSSEHLIMAWGRTKGLATIVLRPFNIFGERGLHHGALNRFIVRAFHNWPILIFGDGRQIRSWCYIDDLVNAFMLTLKKKVEGEIFNIGNPDYPMSILNLARTIMRETECYGHHCTSKIKHLPKRPVDVQFRIPNINKAKRLLGYEPKFDFDKGLQNTMRWYVQNKDKKWLIF